MIDRSKLYKYLPNYFLCSLLLGQGLNEGKKIDILTYEKKVVRSSPDELVFYNGSTMLNLFKVEFVLQ